ncbi:multicopper oxidase [Amylocystis lapponica]|nr:multicopper oxidase [Amylocystis lapponica]
MSSPSIHSTGKDPLALDDAPSAAVHVSTAVSPWRRGAFIVAVSLVLVLALALGLGLGLGLGLNKHSTPRKLPTVTTNASSSYLMNMDLVNESTTTRYFEWTVAEAMGAPDGFQKPMLVVNGQFPGPTIEANEGDRIIVNVTNNLPNATAIHWHGLYQRGTNYYDGTQGITQCGIPPGQWMVYNYTLDDWAGSTWWHAHSGMQYTDGITGALIVHSKNESESMADLYHAFSETLLPVYFQPGGIAGTPGNEPVPDGGTINGIGQWGPTNDTFFNITLQPNKTYRLRLVNAGTFVAMQFSVDAHNLTVVEGDGTPVAPVQASSVSVAVAQRYSVLLRTDQAPGAYWMRAALDQGAFTYDNPATQVEIRAVVRYGVADDTLPDVALLDNPPAVSGGDPGALDTGALVPVGGGPAPNATFSTYFTISMQYAAGGSDDTVSEYLAFINETSWTMLAGTASLFAHVGGGSAEGAGGQLVATIATAQVAEMVVQNFDDGDHPFHLHGYKFWVLGGGAGTYADAARALLNNTAPMLRDTVVIPAYTWMVLRFVADNAGYWAFHCHIQWHMAAGLLMQFSVLPSESAQFVIPQYMFDQCAQ